MARFSFKLPPKEAIGYLEAKRPELHFDYDEIMHEAHHTAFTVAKVTKMRLLGDIHRLLQEAQREGIPFSEFKKRLVPTLQKHGWWGETEVINPKTGEVKEIYVGSRRLRTIFYTNMRVSYNVGRRRHQAQLTESVYLRYIAIIDNRTRPSHAKNHGVVRHRDDPFWATHYPPNGWNCRCRVRAYSMRELQAKGFDAGLKLPTHTVAHKDWAYDVRHGNLEAIEAYAKMQIAKAPQPLAAAATKVLAKRDYHVRKIALEQMVEEVIVKQNQAYEISVIEVGEIAAWIAAAVAKLLGIELEGLGIVLEKNRLLHARPARKKAYDQALRVEEMKRIVDVIAEAKEVYVDRDKKHRNVVFVFEDEQNKEKINVISVGLDRTIKKFGKQNAVLTLDKNDKKDFKAKVKGGILVRVKRGGSRTRNSRR